MPLTSLAPTDIILVTGMKLEAALTQAPTSPLVAQLMMSVTPSRSSRKASPALMMISVADCFLTSTASWYSAACCGSMYLAGLALGLLLTGPWLPAYLATAAALVMQGPP